MEITLEKIELVKDRTGITYKEAKEALEKAEGNVVDAIIAIEESINEESASKCGSKGEALAAKIKEIIKSGNVSRIMVKREDETLINIPLTVGVLGTVVAPVGMIVGVIASFGFKCTIEFQKKDGSLIDLTEKAGVFYEEAKTKAGDIYEGAKEKAPDAYGEFVEKSSELYEEIKEKGGEAFAKAKDVAEDVKAKFAKDGDFVDVDFNAVEDDFEADDDDFDDDDIEKDYDDFDDDFVEESEDEEPKA